MKEIDSYPGYFIDKMGNVTSFRPKNGRGPLAREGRLLKQRVCDDGYLRVGLYRDGKLSRNLLTHIIVADAFLEDCKDGSDLTEVNHKDGVKENNCVSNLERCTKQYNMQHSREVLRRCTGDNHGRAKLSKQNVIEICGSSLTRKELAAKFLVHPSTIERIQKNKGWKHDKITEWASTPGRL